MRRRLADQRREGVRLRCAQRHAAQLHKRRAARWASRAPHLVRPHHHLQALALQPPLGDVGAKRHAHAALRAVREGRRQGGEGTER